MQIENVSTKRVYSEKGLLTNRNSRKVSNLFSIATFFFFFYAKEGVLGKDNMMYFSYIHITLFDSWELIRKELFESDLMRFEESYSFFFFCGEFYGKYFSFDYFYDIRSYRDWKFMCG